MSEIHNDLEISAKRRGPKAHRTRTQLLEAADEHFRRYGYGKTTVADLAKAIGVSPAYVYKFFDSKQSIGEAVCAMTLSRIVDKLHVLADEPRSASERLRRMYKLLVLQGLDLYFHERKLHDIVSAALEERWSSVDEYKLELGKMVRRLVTEGREAGEFERKTPLDDACAAILCTLGSFCHPIMLEQSDQEELSSNADQVANLVLRSLAP